MTKPTLNLTRSVHRLNVILRSLSSRSNTPSIRVEPSDALIDVPVKIQVQGLKENEKVTLSAVLVNDGKEFLSCAHYTADVSGQINTDAQPSEGGSFTGIEPMGLFWAMRPSVTLRRGMRLVKKDVTTPYLVSISVHPSHVDVNSVNNSNVVLISTQIKRWYMGPGVQRIPVREGNIRGALFIPPGDGPFPAVIDMFGGSGGLFDFRGALLASRGFLTLSLAHFLYEDLDEYEDLKLEYYLEATDWLSSQATPGGIGVMGVSFGAAIAYLLASYCPNNKVRAVIAINGPPISVLSHLVVDGKRMKTYPLTFTIEEDGFGKPAYGSLDEETEIVPFWQHGVKVLSISCENDECLDVNLQNVLMEKVPVDKRENIERVRYPGAGHLLEPPYTPLCRESYIVGGLSSDHQFGVMLRWGGETKSHAMAQEDAWRRTLKHFNKYLKH